MDWEILQLEDGNWQIESEPSAEDGAISMITFSGQYSSYLANSFFNLLTRPVDTFVWDDFSRADSNNNLGLSAEANDRLPNIEAIKSVIDKTFGKEND